MKLAKGMDLGDSVLAKVIGNRIIHSAPMTEAREFPLRFTLAERLAVRISRPLWI
jgi:hypothetical protein